MEELKNRLPPYLFMDEEEKKVFLKDQSEKYVREIGAAQPFKFAKKKLKITKVKFDLKRNQTHYFDKSTKISFVNKLQEKIEQNNKVKEANKESNI